MRFILGKIKESNLRPHLPDTISKNDVGCNRYKETNQSQLAYAQRHGHLRKIHGHSLPASSRTGHYAQTGAIRRPARKTLSKGAASNRTNPLPNGNALEVRCIANRSRRARIRRTDGEEQYCCSELAGKESKALIKQDKHVIQVAASTTPYFAAPVIFCHVISKSLAVE